MRAGSYNRNFDKTATLIKAHGKLLRQTIGTYIQNAHDAEDVFQETTLNILERFRIGKPVEHPKAFMLQTARNECVNFYRRTEREANRDIDLSAFINRGGFGGGVSIADDQHQEVVAQEIWDVVAEMGSIYLDVAELSVKGFTAPEISERLGVAEGTVKSRLRKIREKVQEYLEISAAPLNDQKSSSQ